MKSPDLFDGRTAITAEGSNRIEERRKQRFCDRRAGLTCEVRPSPWIIVESTEPLTRQLICPKARDAKRRDCFFSFLQREVTDVLRRQ